MLKFEKVRWKNLLSTGNNFTEVVFNKNHKTILLGSSGSGKSTLLDAITFGLFNRPFRNINKNNLINSINNKNCLVELEFSIGKKKYLIRRGIKPNIFEIFINGKLVKQDASVKDYQNTLEKDILKFNIKSFRQIVVLGAAGFVPFMQLKPQDRRIIIEELLDIEIFSVMNNILKQKNSFVKEEITQHQFNLKLAEEKVLLYKDNIQKQSENREKKLKDNCDKIGDAKEEIKKYEKENEELQEKISLLEDTAKIEDTLKTKLTTVDTTIRRITRERTELESMVDFYCNNSECPTCEQEITEKFKEDKIETSKEKIEELNSNEVKVSDIKEKLNGKIEKVDKLKHKIDIIKTKVSGNESHIKAKREYIDLIELENKELAVKAIANTESKEQLAEAQKDIDECNAKIEELTNQKSLYDTASDLLKDSGVKARIIKQYLPLINKYTNKFLTSMDFFVTFSMDEEFNEAIKARGRDDFSYENFSEGEKQRIDLALLFTWRTIARMKNSINTNLLIMDEVFDSYLDNQATENVIQLLDSDMFSHANIFVISHKNTISDKFDQVIRFDKVKNFSKIVGGNSDYVVRRNGKVIDKNEE